MPVSTGLGSTVRLGGKQHTRTTEGAFSILQPLEDVGRLASSELAGIIPGIIERRILMNPACGTVPIDN